MKNILNNLSFFFFLFSTIIITSCNSPSSNSTGVKDALDAQAQLQRDIAMYEETWTRFLKGDTAVVNEERFQKDVVVVTAQGDIVGIEATKDHYMNFIIGFSDMEFTILEVIGQGNRLVKHWNFKGTHTGVAFGIPASGNKLNLSGTTLVTMKDGKIAKEQDFFDVTAMINQLTSGDVNADAGSPGVL
tara:strand:- start:3727 stop:4290 length:564 start_codon:yes stop_codon:yes gene_type:complete